MEKKIYTVSRLTQKIKSIMREHVGMVCVDGEISNLKVAASGHIYLTLKDAHAQIRLAVFRGVAQLLRFKLEDGQKVRVSGDVTIYEKSGSQYQIIVRYIEPVGVGSLQLAFEQLKKKLKNEGLFDDARKKPLPFLPRRIGVVTSPKGAAICDILDVTGRRCPLSSVVIMPASVQGVAAAGEIACAIDALNRLHTVDVIIVGRGGGSIEDLWAFNEEIVARSIAASTIPVVSAVGHETDFTIADFVADRRAPTPSAAAEIVVPEKEALANRLSALYRQCALCMTGKLAQWRHKIETLHTHYVFKEPQGLIRVYMQRLDELDLRFRYSVETYLRQMRLYVTHISEKLAMLLPQDKMQHYREHLAYLYQRLSHMLSQDIVHRRLCLGMLSEKLNALSPLCILSRGYSICQDISGHVVQRVNAVSTGDFLHTRVMDGVLISAVTEIQKKE